MQLYDAKRYREALQVFLPYAQRGDASAQAMIGNIYYDGRGVSPNHQQAQYWYELAAKQGNRQSQFYLGEIYDEGLGVAKDKAKAAQFYEVAARKGLPQAQFVLGFCYEFADGVPRNRQTAIYWLMQAAKQGDGRARWIADWLRAADTPPRFASPEAFKAYVNGKMSAWMQKYRNQVWRGGPGRSSSSSSGPSGSGAGCGSYSSYAACNAYKAGEIWAADRIQSGTANGAEKSWYSW